MNTTLTHAGAPLVVQEGGSRPAGLLFGRLTLLATILGLAAAVWTEQRAMAALLAVALSASGLTLVWSRFCLASVGCERSISERRLFPGESVEVALRVENRKVLPLPWLEVEDRVPAGLRVEGGRPAVGNVDAEVVRHAAVSWYSAVSWRYRLHARHRGYYALPPVRVSSGDIFGLYRRTGSSAATERIIVYPHLLEPRQLMLPSLNPVGDTASINRVFEDPSRTLGIRDYSPGDGLRRIHWKATARRAALQVRIYEPTTTLKPVLFLAVDSFPGVASAAGAACAETADVAEVATDAAVAATDAAVAADGSAARASFEFAISATASLARNVIEQNGQVGLWVNSCLADTRQPATVPPGGGLTQLMMMLEALAKVTPVVSAPFAAFFEAQREGLSFGVTPMFIIGDIPQGLAAVLVDLRERGHRPHVIQIGRDGAMPPEAHTPGVAWFVVQPRGDLWQEDEVQA